MGGNSLPVIAGHSHCTCMGVPQNSAQLELVALRDDRFVGFTGPWPHPKEYSETLGVAASGRTVCLLWGGNEHQSRFLLSPGRQIDFVLREAPDLPTNPEASLVPDMAIEKRLSEVRFRVRRAVETLMEAGVDRILLCGTPPPKRQTQAFRDRLYAPGNVFRAKAEALGLRIEDVPLADELFLGKTWRVLQRQYEEAAAELSLEFVPVPAEACDGMMLRSDYAANDVTHANSAYGRLMLDCIHARLNGGAA